MGEPPYMVEILLGSLLLLWHGAAALEVTRSNKTWVAKLGWVAAILVLIPFALLAWVVRGRGRAHPRYLGSVGYMSIAIASCALVLAATHGFWSGYEHLAWIGAWSLITLLMYAYDKLAARKGSDASGSSKAERIPENVLHLCALLGGFVGGWLGRHGLRHKTRKRVFAVVLLLATVAHGGAWASALLGLW